MVKKHLRDIKYVSHGDIGSVKKRKYNSMKTNEVGKITRQGISVVIPMYNEEDNIRLCLSLVQKVLTRVTDDYEIVVVNDASTDKSPAIVKELATINGKIRLLNHSVNKKLGGTLKTGFAAAQKDVIIYMDADLPFDMEEVVRAVRIMHERHADVISVYRYSRRGEGLRRMIYSYVYNFIIRVLFGVPIKDVNFSFKIFKKEIFRSFSLLSSGSFIDAELLIMCSRKGYTIAQFGTDYFPRRRGTSRLSSVPVILKIIYEMIRFRIFLLLQPKNR